VIILSTYKNERGVEIVSHGIDELLRTVILSNEPLDYYRRVCGARYSPGIGEWVIDEKYESECA
jgi:hypothetical protein